MFYSVLKKIFFGLLVLSLTGPAYSHSPFLYPPAPGPVISPFPTPYICPYNFSSFCHTHSGNVCSLFTINYQASWFSTCLADGFLYACLNLPSLPAPLAQNTCHFIGSPCACYFGWINGHYIYETGIVL